MDDDGKPETADSGTGSTAESNRQRNRRTVAALAVVLVVVLAGVGYLAGWWGDSGGADGASPGSSGPESGTSSPEVSSSDPVYGGYRAFDVCKSIDWSPIADVVPLQEGKGVSGYHDPAIDGEAEAYGCVGITNQGDPYPSGLQLDIAYSEPPGDDVFEHFLDEFEGDNVTELDGPWEKAAASWHWYGDDNEDDPEVFLVAVDDSLTVHMQVDGVPKDADLADPGEALLDAAVDVVGQVFELTKVG